MKFRIAQQIEELVDAIERVPQLEGGRFAKKSVVEYRQARLRAALATLRWVQENEEGVRAYASQARVDRSA